MNFKNILSEIENTDPELYEKTSGRREILKSMGSKVVAAAIPFAASSLFSKAYGKTTANAVLDSLNAILEQEYLEYAFFRHGTNTGNLIPAADLPGFQAIEAHKKALVGYVNGTIVNGLGAVSFVPKHYTDPTTNAPYVPAAYDFTAAGAYPAVFSDYGTFLMVAQIITDTGVRAIKGQMPGLSSNVNLLTQVMQIQATKARHAAYVRLMRRLRPAISPEYPAPWITNNIPPSIPLQPYYTQEDNATQKGIIITTLPDSYVPSGVVPQMSATAAFDEPLDLTTANNLMAPFKVA